MEVGTYWGEIKEQKSRQSLFCAQEVTRAVHLHFDLLRLRICGFRRSPNGMD